MMTLEQARERLLGALSPLPSETLSLAGASGRVAAVDLIAQIDVPRFDNSAVDGYAVRSQDLADIAQGTARPLRQVGRIAAGDPAKVELQPKSCARVFTGAPLPQGADAVVMQEDVRRLDGEMIEFSSPVPPWEGIRLAGEDVRRGALLVAAGQHLRPAHVGLLAAAGTVTVDVHRRPRVSLTTTGSELVGLGEPLGPGCLPDSNQPLLIALARAEGVEIVDCRRVEDSLELIQDALRAAAETSDVLVTTGGVSVGEADLLKEAVASLGGRVELWRLALKPGKPFVWGRLGNAHWFGLPGNPVSAFVTWRLLVVPALRRLQGDRNPVGRRWMTRLADAITNRGDRLHVLRVSFDSQGRVRPSGPQASHIQSGLAAADALLSMPPATSWPAGHEVEVELLDGL